MDYLQYEKWVIQQLLETQSTPECATPEIDLRVSIADNFSVSPDRSYRILKRIIQHNNHITRQKWTEKEFAVIYH